MSKAELDSLNRMLDVGLRQWFHDERGLVLSPGITAARDSQIETLEWVASRAEPYLFVNAPTGVGKTLLNAMYGVMSEKAWTYLVHTNALQDQVARTFENLPTLRGRRNFECLIEEVMADEAECALDSDSFCPHKFADGPFCSYYGQRAAGLSVPHRTANYALFLRDRSLREADRETGKARTQILLADEAHNIESAVVASVEISLNKRTCRRFGINLPAYTSIAEWAAWAETVPVPKYHRGDKDSIGAAVVGDAVRALRRIRPEEEGNWLITPEVWGVKFEPVWGGPFVMPRLFGHYGFENGAVLANTGTPILRALMTSATLMGAEYIADTLGLPDGSWAYLDLPSPFPVRNRPINFCPVDGMNAAKVNDYAGRTKMREAIDRLIEFYVLSGSTSGVIHAVSNKYRDFILTESRWQPILTTDPTEHAEKVARKEASVIVAANLAEGWDGVDELCRFVIMPKVPFPNLGDRRTSVRKDEDQRSFDHAALVAVVQGAGRGVRHATDTADTWILDSNWSMLYKRRQAWLPEAFTSAYHHRVQLP